MSLSIDQSTFQSGHLARALWLQLWQHYRQRVEYARTYEAMIQSAGGTVANDHIAFRSLKLTVQRAHGSIDLGIAYLAKIVEALGYQMAGDYHFPDRHLYARHYHHPAQAELELPKLFISELLVDELPTPLATQIYDTVKMGQFFSLSCWQEQCQVIEDKCVQQLASAFTRPWVPPNRTVVEAVNAVSQYGAWVLLYGYAVNHFTACINRQQVYGEIALAAKALAAQGVPMKPSLEGSPASGLQQTATQAVVESVPVLNDAGQLEQMPWRYAYYELAQRHRVENAAGEDALFQGFIGPQAQHLFEMTRTEPSPGK
ncbi:MAG: DUF1338 domain-containing protein [Cyanobacteria bacterium J06635_1]